MLPWLHIPSKVNKLDAAWAGTHKLEWWLFKHRTKFKWWHTNMNDEFQAATPNVRLSQNRGCQNHPGHYFFLTANQQTFRMPRFFSHKKTLNQNVWIKYPPFSHQKKHQKLGILQPFKPLVSHSPPRCNQCNWAAIPGSELSREWTPTRALKSMPCLRVQLVVAQKNYALKTTEISSSLYILPGFVWKLRAKNRRIPWFIMIFRHEIDGTSRSGRSGFPL